MVRLEAIETGWDLRISNPRGALERAEPLFVHPDPEVRALARSTAAYATLRLTGPRAAEALLRAKAPGGGLGRGRLLVVRGAIHLNRGRYPEAIRCFQQGAVLLEAAGQAQDAAGSLINVAAVRRRIGDAPGALALLTEAAGRFRGLSDTYGEAAALISSAQILQEQGDQAAALPLAQRAHSLAARLRRPGFFAFVQANLGRVLVDSGERARGVALLEEAVGIARRAGVPQAIGEALGHLGVALVAQEPARARAILEEAVALVQDQGDPMTICLGLIALGDASTGREAHQHYAAAALLADHRGEPTQATAAHRAAARTAPDPDTELRHWRAFAAAVDQQQDRDRSDRLARLQAAALLEELRARDEAAREHIARHAAAARHSADLLAIALHDLRNPLQAAKGHAELMALSGTPTDTIQQPLDRIAQILSLVEAEVRAEVTDPQLEDLLPLVLAIVSERRCTAEAKQQRLSVEGASVPAPLFASRLYHAVDNLISNAMKFSPPGATITVRVLRARQGARVEVIDQGPGIRPEDLPRLFQRAYRGAARPTGGERSTGMGLYIARKMVELHGGQIGAEPISGGTRFFITLPVSSS